MRAPGSRGHRALKARRPMAPAGTLQVDSRTQRSGRSPSVSPDRGSTPTSPYSVPQIAPFPAARCVPYVRPRTSRRPPASQTSTPAPSVTTRPATSGVQPQPHLTQVITSAPGFPNPTRLPRPPGSLLSWSFPLGRQPCVSLGWDWLPGVEVESKSWSQISGG